MNPEAFASGYLNLRKVYLIMEESKNKEKNENKSKVKENPVIAEMIKETETKLCGNGRVLIRPSGTEPVVRVMIEGTDKEMIEKDAKNIASYIEKEMA